VNFPHSLVLIQANQSGTSEDDYGQPVYSGTTETPFIGWLQPRSSQELRQGNDSGAALTTHLLFAPVSLPLSKNDHVRWDVSPDDLRRYEVNGDPRDAAGMGHHFEADMRQVTD